MALTEAEQRAVRLELQRRVDAEGRGGQSKVSRATGIPQPQISAVLGERSAPTPGMRDRLSGKVPVAAKGKKKKPSAPAAAATNVSFLKPPPPRLVPSKPQSTQTSELSADEMLDFLKSHGRADLVQQIYTWFDETYNKLAMMRKQRP